MNLSEAFKQLERSSLVAGVSLTLLLGLNGCSQLPHSRSYHDDYTLKSGCHTGRYIVQKGDGVLKIAKKCGINSLALINANALLPPFYLRVGQRLIIPRTQYEAQRHFQRQLQPPKTAWQLPVTQQDDSNNIDTLLKIKDKRLFVPTQKLTFLYPVAPGKVVYIGKALPAYGLMVMVKHADGYLSVYTHLAASFVKKGQQVTAQTQLGLIIPTRKPEKTPFVEARYLGRRVSIYPLLSGNISASTTSRSSVVKTL